VSTEPQGDPAAAPSRPGRATAVAASEAPAAKPVQQHYPVSRLLEDPSILGVSTPALAAALADARVSDYTLLTRAEAEALIAKSQDRPIPIPEEA
jgi:hypothetical protein